MSVPEGGGGVPVSPSLCPCPHPCVHVPVPVPLSRPGRQGAFATPNRGGQARGRGRTRASAGGNWREGRVFMWAWPRGGAVSPPPCAVRRAPSDSWPWPPPGPGREPGQGPGPGTSGRTPNPPPASAPMTARSTATRCWRASCCASCPATGYGSAAPHVRRHRERARLDIPPGA